LDVNGCVVNLKTSSKKPSAPRASQKLQLTIYTLITPGASGQYRIDSVVKTKTPQLVQQKYTVSKADVRYAETMLASVQAAARAGVYTPHRESMFCNRSKCAYRRACGEEFGGEVAGGKEE
jgi:CRISPR/Cas system-associated exonuclease Cas4 (RecB family)